LRIRRKVVAAKILGCLASEGEPMLSRVADSLYWMSRYLERAEHTTRLLDVNLNLMLDEKCGKRRASLATGTGRAVQATRHRVDG
jgi:uncharacterized alpha-E superfamily protein